MILLDTDHVSILRHREDSRHDVLVAKLLHAADVVVSVISMEEQMRAWLAELRRQHAKTLRHNALLLSSNLVHFQRVPGLRVEDWVYGRDQSQSS